MRQRLAFLFLLIFATIYPAPSCRYDTYAQEPGDIVVDGNDGVAPLAVGDIAYKSFESLIQAKVGDGYFWYANSPSTSVDESLKKLYLYTYILKDIPDDDGYDSWYYYGCLIGYTTPDNSSVSSWRRFVFYGELHRINGAWAVKKLNAAFGLPGYTGTNEYGVTYAEGANFFEQYVAALRKYAELTETTFNPAGQYDHYVNWETHDTDNGGVNNLAEWVRGTSIRDVYDDKAVGGACVCGACCSCKCVCGKWSGEQCAGSTDGCACHKDDLGPPPENCVCADACCACTCACTAHETSFRHWPHKNGEVVCTNDTDDGGCDCHKTTDDPDDPPEGCICSDYCCLCKCPCDVHSDGTHDPHGNNDTTCDGSTRPGYGCECHNETDNPELECTCLDYCCFDKCACEYCAGTTHAVHQNGLRSCDQTDGESGCECHTTTEEKEEFDPPDQPDFEELDPDDRKDLFERNYESDPNSFSGALNRLRNALNDKFKIDVLASWFDPDFSGDLPRFDVPLPNEMGTIIIDFATLKTYSDMLMLRSVLTFGVFWYFISAVIRDVKKFL